MANHRIALGAWGQAQARDYLQRRGYKIVVENARLPEGEIDIVVLAGGVLVFVEVRTRSSRNLGTPEESVTPRKQAQMVRVAQAYLQAHPDSPESWRIDVVAVEGNGQGRPWRVTHLPNAVEG